MPLGAEVGLGPGDIVFDGDAAPPTERGTAPLPTFWAMSVVAKRSPITTAEHLSNTVFVRYSNIVFFCVFCMC